MNIVIAVIIEALSFCVLVNGAVFLSKSSTPHRNTLHHLLTLQLIVASVIAAVIALDPTSLVLAVPFGLVTARVAINAVEQHRSENPLPGNDSARDPRRQQESDGW